MVKRMMHGVGLLRVSKTPVTVDSEEYVVFVDGWLAPRGFPSWVQANAYFLECAEINKKRRLRRFRSSVILKPGPRPGAIAYFSAAEAEETGNG